MRRLVVAIAVLLAGVLGVGVVTALGRSGDGGTPRAQPSASPFTSEPPTTVPTDEPTIEPTTAPTSPPATVPTSPPATSGNGNGGNGSGDGSGGDGTPDMPSTGASPLLALAGIAGCGASVALRRRSARSA